MLAPLLSPQAEGSGDESWGLRADLYCSTNDTEILAATADVWVAAPAGGELQVRARVAGWQGGPRPLGCQQGGAKRLAMAADGATRMPPTVSTGAQAWITSWNETDVEVDADGGGATLSDKIQPGATWHFYPHPKVYTVQALETEP